MNNKVLIILGILVFVHLPLFASEYEYVVSPSDDDVVTLAPVPIEKQDLEKTEINIPVDEQVAPNANHTEVVAKPQIINNSDVPKVETTSFSKVYNQPKNKYYKDNTPCHYNEEGRCLKRVPWVNEYLPSASQTPENIFEQKVYISPEKAMRELDKDVAEGRLDLSKEDDAKYYKIMRARLDKEENLRVSKMSREEKQAYYDKIFHPTDEKPPKLPKSSTNTYHYTSPINVIFDRILYWGPLGLILIGLIGLIGLIFYPKSPKPEEKEKEISAGAYGDEISYDDNDFIIKNSLNVLNNNEIGKLSKIQEQNPKTNPQNNCKICKKSSSPAILLDPEKYRLKNILQRRKIRKLIHFTNIKNLESILKNGILPRKMLEENGFLYKYSDDNRIEDRTDCTCLTVEYPNNRMLYMKKQKGDKYVILVLDAESIILNNSKKYFLFGNAASARLALKNDDLTDASYFEEMFEDGIVWKNKIMYRNSKLPSYISTFDQAEILINGKIDVRDIKEVHFEYETDYNNFKYSCTDKKLLNYFQFVSSKYYFQKRENVNWEQR